METTGQSDTATNNPSLPQEIIAGAVDLSPDKDGGVLKVILQEGHADEKPGQGDDVYVHYVGTLLDGTKFDSSRDRGDQFSFKLGEGRVIKAWDLGVATMKRGEMCRLICRSDYAYGDNGSPPTIPPNATLIFTVELFNWRGEDLSENKDGGIIRSVIQKGDGYMHPSEGSLVQVSLKGTYGDIVFDERDVTFTVGDGDEEGVVDGVDLAIQKFKKGETSKLTLGPGYAYGAKGQPEGNIPANASVQFEVTLKEFEKAKETYELEPEEKLQQSELMKTKGTDLFKAGEFTRAVKKYKRVIDLLEDTTEYTEEPLAKRSALLLAVHLNTALCQLKLDNWQQAKNNCNAALDLEQNSEKAYFRRGQAFMGTKDWNEAKQDFDKVLEIDPNNKSARNQLKVADHHIKVEKEKSKKMYAGMFQKFAEQDAKIAALQEAKGGIKSEQPISYWSNDMADGMMSLQQEMEAFGERMPERPASAASDDTEKENTASS